MEFEIAAELHMGPRVFSAALFPSHDLEILEPFTRV